MTTIATAYVALVPSMKGAQGAIAKELGGVNLDEAGRKSGSSWLGGAAKMMGGAAVAAIGATAGLAIKKGIDRALTLENAEAKLTGLGHSAESVSSIMDNALNAVRGTAFGMGDAATVAASAVAAGIKPGADLERTLKLVGDAATIAGGDMGSMGAIFNKVAASNKVQMDVINQLHDQGVPALSLLADQLGVTAEEASKMASRGEIDFATFQTAMEAGMGGAALKSGETTQGAFNNMMAALGRLGEKAISGVFPKFAGLFTGITGLIDSMGPSVEAFGTWAGDMFDRVAAGAGAIATLFRGDFNASVREGLGVEEDSPLVDFILTLRETATGAFAEITGGVRAMVAGFQAGGNDVTSSGFAGFLESLGLFGRQLWDSLGPTISQLLPQVVTLASAFSPLGLIMDVLLPVLPQIGQALSSIALALSGALASILPTIVGLMASLAATLSGALATVLPIVVDLVLSLVEAFSGALVTLLPVVVTLVQSLAAVLAQALPVVLPVIVKLVESLAGALSGQLAKILPVVVSIITTLAGVIASLLPVLLPVISTLLDALLPVFLSLVEAAMPLVGMVLPLIASLLTALVPVINPLVQLLAAVLVPVVQLLGGVLEVVIGIIGGLIGWFVDLISNTDAVGGAFSTVKDTIGRAWAAIESGISLAWNFIRDSIFGPIKLGVAAVGVAFDLAKAVMTGAWETVKTGVSTVWNWVRDNVFTPFSNGVAAIGTAFEGARDAVKTAWNELGNIARKPVNFILKTVYTDGIKAVFDKIASAVGLDLTLPTAKEVPEFSAASGGVLPGWTPGRDVHHFTSPTGGRLNLSGGEAFMVPEFTRAVGGAAGVARLNAQARAGALGERSFFMGGVVDWLGNAASNVGDFVSNAAAGVRDMVVNAAAFLRDPAEGIRTLIGTPVNRLLETVGGGDFAQALVEVPPKLVGGLVEKVKDLVSGMFSSDAGSLPDLTGGAGFQRPSRGRITSLFGPRSLLGGTFHNGVDYAGGGATYAAGAGRVSRVGWNVGYGNTGIGIMLNHGEGLETYYGHNPSLAAVKVKVGDLVSAGQHIGWEGSTGNVTGDHLHWSAFREGRAFNPLSLFDNGGWLMPGQLGVNMTNQPEPVFNASQWQTLEGNLAGADPGPTILHVYDSDGVLQGTMRAEATRVLAAVAGAALDDGDRRGWGGVHS